MQEIAFFICSVLSYNGTLSERYRQIIQKKQGEFPHPALSLNYPVITTTSGHNKTVIEFDN